MTFFLMIHETIDQSNYPLPPLRLALVFRLVPTIMQSPIGASLPTGAYLYAVFRLPIERWKYLPRKAAVTFGIQLPNHSAATPP